MQEKDIEGVDLDVRSEERERFSETEHVCERESLLEASGGQMDITGGQERGKLKEEHPLICDGKSRWCGVHGHHLDEKHRTKLYFSQGVLFFLLGIGTGINIGH
jgi:hypothetical protein